MTAPVENKTAVQTVTTAVVAVISWLLTRDLGALDPGTSALISGGASVAVGFIFAWMTKHTPRVEEVIEQALDILAANGHQPGTAGSTVAPVAVVDAPVAPVEDAPVAATDDDVPAPSPDYPPSDVDTNA